jgi:GT2 family glycosyltransferase
MSDSIELTLIICTYRRPREVERLLRAVAAQSRVPDETLIVDGSHDDETERTVRAFVQEKEIEQGRVVRDLKYFRVPPTERGLTRQRNYGIAHARGHFVSFLDDDTVPEPDYFAETLACFERHAEACGVGGFITNEVEWWRRTNANEARRNVSQIENGSLNENENDDVGESSHTQESSHTRENGRSLSSASVSASPRPRVSASVFSWGEWERREAYRWRLRKALGLASELPPGWMPSAGHGRPVGYLPPDGEDHPVEFFMGCAFTFRREVFARHKFSRYFEGYGLYEDMDFCVRAAQDAPLYLSTRARLAHYHAPAGRPSQFRYGRMVVCNGWFVWRRRHTRPPFSSRARWWATTALLAACQLADAVRGPDRWQQLTEALGRASGMATLLLSKPKDSSEPEVLSDVKATEGVVTHASNA